MLFWNKDGSIKNQELYLVDPNPTEEGQDITHRLPKKADALRNKLLAHLYLVNA